MLDTAAHSTWRGHEGDTAAFRTFTTGLAMALDRGLEFTELHSVVTNPIFDRRLIREIGEALLGPFYIVQ